MVLKAGALGTQSALVESVHRLQDICQSTVFPGSSVPSKPLIAITVGDVCGVGPEIILKALAHKNVQRLGKYICLGIPERMELATTYVKGCKIRIKRVNSIDECVFDPNVLEVYCPFEYVSSSKAMRSNSCILC